LELTDRICISERIEALLRNTHFSSIEKKIESKRVNKEICSFCQH
jgi:hypothetical protein